MSETKPRPTIAELEAILAKNAEDVGIEILPNGEIRAKDNPASPPPPDAKLDQNLDLLVAGIINAVMGELVAPQATTAVLKRLQPLLAEVERLRAEVDRLIDIKAPSQWNCPSCGHEMVTSGVDMESFETICHERDTAEAEVAQLRQQQMDVLTVVRSHPRSLISDRLLKILKLAGPTPVPEDQP